jgi:hypothetical protein
MTENVLGIQTISNKRTDKLTDCVLLLGQVKEEKEKANPSHFLKFLFTNHTKGTLGFARHPASYRDQRFVKPKEPFLPTQRERFRILYRL